VAWLLPQPLLLVITDSLKVGCLMFWLGDHEAHFQVNFQRRGGDKTAVDDHDDPTLHYFPADWPQVEAFGLSSNGPSSTNRGPRKERMMKKKK